MYYHPYMFHWANGERALSTCQACVSLWLDGVARQQQAHAEAMSAFYSRHLDALRDLSEASDTAQFAARLLACTGPKPFDMAEFATRLGGIAAETHRKLGEVVRSHADDVTTSWVEGRARAGEERRKLASGGRSGERRQMVA